MIENIKFFLRDLDPAVVNAWNDAFKEYQNFKIELNDIFSGEPADAIISPANSFGVMDGGIDLAYTRFFGEYLPQRLQKRIIEKWHGEIPVGNAEIICIDREDYKYLISAPTMRVPQVIRFTANAYLAFRAAILAVIDHNENCSYQIASILCPGLGTATGELPAEICARQMRLAYDSILHPRTETNFHKIITDYYTMIQ